MRSIWQAGLFLAGAATLASAAPAQEVSGDAVAGLVSRQAKGEVHLSIDPKLADGRLVLRIVILNRGAASASFAPADVHVTTPDGAAIALVPRETLLAEQGGGSGHDRSESSQLHAAPAMPVNGAGQTDVSGYTGGMGATTAGVPQATLDQNRTPSPAVAALDAVLLKPIVLKPGAADGGQVVTTRLPRKTPMVSVAISFAGEEHRFQVAVPKR